MRACARFDQEYEHEFSSLPFCLLKYKEFSGRLYIYLFWLIILNFKIVTGVNLTPRCVGFLMLFSKRWKERLPLICLYTREGGGMHPGRG